MKTGNVVGPDQATGVVMAANERYLRRDAFDAPVDGANDNDVGAAVA